MEVAMTEGWLLVILVGTATAAIKAAGPAVLGGRSLPPSLRHVLARLPPALFAALVATQVFARGRELSVDARLGGLVTAALCVHLRVPAAAVVLLAAAVTAALRLVLP
jgi:branched-subunit amino acid transport protein